MKKTNVALMAAALTLATSCTEVKQESNAPIIGRHEITVKDGRMTPEALWAMGRIGNMSVSPDGKKIAYTLAIPKGDENTWEDTFVTLPAPFGGTYRTIGSPTAGIEENIPLRWNKKVHLERFEG